MSNIEVTVEAASSKQCKDCLAVKPLDCFSPRFNQCKPCRAARQAEVRAKNPHLYRDWYRANRDREIIKSREYRQRNAEKYRQYARNYTKRLRAEVLAVYGGACKCCGETTPEFLAIDHIHNDGAAERKITGDGRSFYVWLKKQGFPQDRYQLLCHNCNFAKGRYGECPHRRHVGILDTSPLSD